MTLMSHCNVNSRLRRVVLGKGSDGGYIGALGVHSVNCTLHRCVMCTVRSGVRSGVLSMFKEVNAMMFGWTLI